MSFDDRWLAYLRAHSKQGTRAAHYAGITLIVTGVVWSYLTGNPWPAVNLTIIGFLAAWASHIFIEGNKPAMFTGNPFYSVLFGMRFYLLAATGRLGPHLDRANG